MVFWITGTLGDYGCGVSGGVGNAGEPDSGFHIRFYSYFPKYFGIRSLLGRQSVRPSVSYGEVIPRTDPPDFAAIMKSPAEYEVVATNALTGEARYFGKEEMKQDDYRPIMASSSPRHTARS